MSYIIGNRCVGACDTACVPVCPPDAIYDTEDECIDAEGNDESVRKNYEFFGQEWD